MTAAVAYPWRARHDWRPWRLTLHRCRIEMSDSGVLDHDHSYSPGHLAAVQARSTGEVDTARVGPIALGALLGKLLEAMVATPFGHNGRMGKHTMVALSGHIKITTQTRVLAPKLTEKMLSHRIRVHEAFLPCLDVHIVIA